MGESELAASAMSAEDVEEQRLLMLNSPAGQNLTKTLQGKINNAISYLKEQTVKQYTDRLGYKFGAGFCETKEEAVEAHKASLRLLWCTLGEEGKQLVPLNSEDIVSIARKYIDSERLRVWRTSPFEKLRANKNEKRAQVYDNNGGADIFFNNFPARRCYERFVKMGRKSKLKGDASILQLARLDAWMGTKILMNLRTVEDACPDEGDADEEEPPPAKSGKKRKRTTSDYGNTRNMYHNTVFEILLPRAIEGVLWQIRNAVMEESPK